MINWIWYWLLFFLCSHSFHFTINHWHTIISRCNDWLLLYPPYYYASIHTFLPLCFHFLRITTIGSWQRSAYSINHSITIFGESCYFIAFPKKCGYALPGHLPSSWKRTILKKPDYCALLLNVHCSHLKKTNFYMDGRFEWKPHGLALLWKTDK